MISFRIFSKKMKTVFVSCHFCRPDGTTKCGECAIVQMEEQDDSHWSDQTMPATKDCGSSAFLQDLGLPYIPDPRLPHIQSAIGSAWNSSIMMVLLFIVSNVW
jgi:hypothetical protein